VPLLPALALHGSGQGIEKYPDDRYRVFLKKNGANNDSGATVRINSDRQGL
jgi:hypothetical protein